MKIVFISSMSAFPWGGSEELWSQTAIRLATRGHTISASVVYWAKPSSKITTLSEHGITLFVRKLTWYKKVQRLWHWISHQPKEQQDRLWLLKQKADLVVIAQGGSSDGAEWMKICTSAGLPFTVIVQCNNDLWWPKDKMVFDLAQVYHAARKVFFVSRNNQKLLEYQIGIHLPHGEFVWNPCNVMPLQQIDWPPVLNDVWKLACVARLDPVAKGQDLLLQVLACPQWRNRSVEVNLYGKGWQEQCLRRLADLLQLKHVHFHGHVSNIAEIWEQNHILILPSRFEGMSLALLEAMWCGRPAVVTDVGGNTEMCIDGETGFVVPAPAVGLLEQTMEQAWASRNNWKHMGVAARTRAEQLIPKDPVDEFCQKLLGCVE